MKTTTIGLRFAAASLPALFALLTAGSSAAQQTCDTVIKCAQAAVEAAQAAQRAAQNAFPTGSVLAFRLRDCPAGWVPATDLAGRVIVGGGLGNLDENKRSLTERRLGQTGGEEAHKLTVAELPAHVHSVQGFSGVDRGGGGGKGGNGLFGANPTASGNAGGDQPHNTLPPFLVLTYCEKK